MASIGHWANLAEAEKLTQSILVAGLIEENVKEGGILPMLPLAQFSGLSAKWNREATIPSTQKVDKGGMLTWQEAATVTTVETPLKIKYVQTVLDHFVEEVYGNINNYQSIQLMQDKKSMLQDLEDGLIYDDLSFDVGTLSADGLHALAQASNVNFNNETLDIDEGEAGLQLVNLRNLEDNMLHGIDLWLFPRQIATRLDAYVQENGLTTNTFGSINFTMDELGKKVTQWNGVPILRSHYLVPEQANTGRGSDARGKHTSGDKQYSVLALKFGQVMNAEPGLTFAFGGSNVGAGELWKTIFFPNLEDFDAAGLRLVHYGALLDGSTVAIGRIHDIEDVAVIV